MCSHSSHTPPHPHHFTLTLTLSILSPTDSPHSPPHLHLPLELPDSMLCEYGEEKVDGDAEDREDNCPVRVQQEESLSLAELHALVRCGVIVHTALKVRIAI